MVGREVLLRVEKEAPPRRGEPLLEVRDLVGRRRPRAARRSTASRSRCAAARSSRIAGDRRQRADRADRRDRRAAAGAGRHDPRRRPGRHRVRGPRDARRRARPHRRGPPAPRARARLHARREPRAARLPRRSRASAALARSASPSARDELLEEFDVRGGGPETLARALAGGNQQKVVIAREIDRDPERARRGAADARPRRRRDRVRPPAPGRRARRGPRDAARLARARGGPLARRPDPRHLRGRASSASCRRRVTEEELGLLMTGGGARAGGGRVSTPPPARRRGPGARRRAGRLSGFLRSGGVLDPGAHRAARLPGRRARRRARRARTRSTTYKAIFEGTGLNWLLPWTGRPGVRRGQPAADADPHDAADPRRASRSPSPSAPGCSTSAARASTPSARSSPSGSAPRCRASRPCCTSCSRSCSARSRAVPGPGSPGCCGRPSARTR